MGNRITEWMMTQVIILKSNGLASAPDGNKPIVKKS